MTIDATDKTLLLVDDDVDFCQVLKLALTKRGFKVTDAQEIKQAMARISEQPPAYAIVDLNLPKESGLTLIPKLLEQNPAMRILVLTGYASIATAVEAIKLGAVHYLTKPADADEILAALDRTEGDMRAGVSDTPTSLTRLEWEHIQKVLVDCDGNISAAARKLGMHRRTLQRKLHKRPSKIE